jgi:two-component system nitrate/nitrite response regulator NarL
MAIAEATVKVHVKAILRKIRVQNRTQAAIWGANNRSLARTANNSSPPATVSKLLPKPAAVISEIEQIATSDPQGLIQQTTHVDVSRIDQLPRIDQLLRKDINPRSLGTARLGK